MKLVPTGRTAKDVAKESLTDSLTNLKGKVSKKVDQKKRDKEQVRLKVQKEKEQKALKEADRVAKAQAKKDAQKQKQQAQKDKRVAENKAFKQDIKEGIAQIIKESDEKSLEQKEIISKLGSAIEKTATAMQKATETTNDIADRNAKTIESIQKLTNKNEAATLKALQTLASKEIPVPEVIINQPPQEKKSWEFRVKRVGGMITSIRADEVEI